METTNPTHFQLGIQITYYIDILCYCTGSHVTRSAIVPEVMLPEVLLYQKLFHQKCCCTTSHMVSGKNSWKEISS